MRACLVVFALISLVACGREQQAPTPGASARPEEDAAPAAPDMSSQYLLPARSSVLRDPALLSAAPLYKDFASIMADRPQAFRMGPEVRRWLEAEKKGLQARLFAFQ